MFVLQVLVLISLLIIPAYSDVETRAGLVQVFHDDFSGGLDHSKWTNEIAASGFGNGEFQIYSPESRNCFVKDGILYLKPTLTVDRFGKDFLEHGILDIVKTYGNCTSSHGCYHDASKDGIIQPAMSCKLKSTGSVRYGRVEVWAKMPKGDWLWPAIWLVPRDKAYGVWPRSGEIDIAELRGNLHNSGGTPNQVTSTIHFGTDWQHGHRQISHTHWNGHSYARDFHKFVMDWTASHIYISIDDRMILNATTPPDGYFHHYLQGNSIYTHGGKDAPFDKQFYMILNVAVGSTKGWFQDKARNTPYPKPG
ncbi:beta-1,3-glucan-binding protein-like [Liolophura sinensis]|uniref:beta-1,3-glucan-binding protein-like n=1 Tax=Liolophura sinensis TaxID=3198878 RepID=UPI0031598918